MQMKHLIASCVSLGLLMPGLIFADTTNINAKKAFPDPKINFSGYIDGSYNYLTKSNSFTSGVADRVYDLNENGFTLQQAAFTLSATPDEGLGALVNAMVGRDALTTNAYGMGSVTNSQDLAFDLTQLYLQYAHSGWTVLLGKFVALNGVETIDPTADTNYSRSILFGYAGPFTLLGARATYVFNDKLKLVVGVNDGWDTIRDFGRRPTIELSGAYVFNPVYSLSAVVYNGVQRAVDRTSSGPTGTRTLIDLVFTITATEKLSFIFNFDYAWQTDAALANGNDGHATWDGLAAYLNYKFNDVWQTSLRGEVFDDQNGARTGVDQTWKAATVTVGYTPFCNKNIELRGEVRHDFSNTASFADKGHSGGSGKNQQSFALEGFYKFG